MVRLKGTSPSAKCASCTISIPHGTIKSQGGPAQVHAHDHISIPHGTIKSFYVPNRIIDDAISIPHGTIKSLMRSLADEPPISFQFHMVRLKGAVQFVMKVV